MDREYQMDLRAIMRMRGDVDVEFRHDWDEESHKIKIRKLKIMEREFKEKHGEIPLGFSQVDLIEHPFDREFKGDDHC